MVFNWSTLFIIVFLCMVGIIAIETNKQGIAWENTTEKLDVAYLNLTNILEINESAIDFGDVLINIVYKVVDTSIYVMINVSKIAGKLAIDNPQINPWLIIKLILALLILSIIVPLIKLLVVLWILIYDTIQHFKDKRKIKKLKGGKENDKKN